MHEGWIDREKDPVERELDALAEAMSKLPESDREFVGDVLHAVRVCIERDGQLSSRMKSALSRVFRVIDNHSSQEEAPKDVKGGLIPSQFVISALRGVGFAFPIKRNK